MTDSNPSVSTNVWTRRGFTALAASGVAGAASAAVKLSPVSSIPMTRRQEAEALRKFAETTHPDDPAASIGAEWRHRADAFVAAADQLDDARYPVQAMRLLSGFKDGHTAVYVPDLHSAVWGQRLPLGRDVFSDGLYVTSAKEEAASLLGAKITHISAVPTEEIIRRFEQVWPSAGPSWVHRWSILLLSSPGFLHAFGFLNGPPDAPVALEGMPGGSIVRASVRPCLDGAKDRTPLPRLMSDLETYAATQSYGSQPDPTEDGRNFVRHMDRHRVIYVSLDRMGPDDFSKPFEIFDREVSNALQSETAKRLIIDLRRNGGGDNMLCEPMRKRVQRSKFNRPVGLYVPIAPHTFSAAQNLANRLERETFAVFVGEPTGASPNQCGDPKPFKGAVTGLPAQVSTLRWMDSPPFDKRASLMPDLLVPRTFADFASGRDSAFEAALSHIDQRPFDDGILSAPWERETQALVWKPFWS